MALPQWELFALRYATVARKPQENFIGAGADPHETASHMDYFVWFARHEGDVVLVDTGFTAQAAAQRKRQFLRCPMASLNQAGIALTDIGDTIITHAHYDHAGNIEQLRFTRFHLQAREMQYATGPEMRHPFMRHAYDVEDVCGLVRANHQERVVFADGDAEIRPGITVHWVGGHTQGLQIVRVHTRNGWMVLASDAAHYLENLHRRAPFPIVYHVGDMMRGFDRVLSLAETPEHIIPGHDPITSSSFKRVGPEGLDLFDLTVRI